MKRKQIIGLLVLILGIVVIIYAVHSMNRIKAAKGEVSTASSMFGGSTAGKAAGGALMGEASKYDTTVMLLLVGGIVLVIVGGATFVLGKKRR